MQLSNQQDKHGNQQEICRGKKERNQMGKSACYKVLFSLFGVVKNHIIYDDPTLLSSFQYPSSIQSLILVLFNSVLGPKKSFESGPRTWAKILLAAGISTFTLDIQTGISWASDIEIKQFKSPNSSTCPGLQLWWRIQIEIKSF